MFLRKLFVMPASTFGLRLSQKFIFLLFLSAFVTFCIGAIFFLPDSARLKRIFLPQAESQKLDSDLEKTSKRVIKKSEETVVKKHEKLKGSSVHQTGDGGTEGRQTGQRIFGKDGQLNVKGDQTLSTQGDATSRERNAQGQSQAPWSDTDQLQAMEATTTAHQNKWISAGGLDYKEFHRGQRNPPLGVAGGKPHDSETQKRREKVKEMTKFAWDKYREYAWGKNELRPLTKSGHIGNMFVF
ncbi:mannosyl-oligosaccharide 1,2-alpha-mannosidase IC-like [Protopterus annectens]|uniref:mannosyl-oligosaccharide 1,2-alpha-mannosidase IC-like n=1 Tax=Protopterus annectens TaxID=7888 RepID=UPI001CFA6951|nr:mannosyl-oligosaccharide 1,2-alpha-mannosidase IC-like [Protopterus annectens]